MRARGWLAICAACALAGGGAGWLLHHPPPAPAVQAKTEATLEKRAAVAAETHEARGPERITITDFAPTCIPQLAAPQLRGAGPVGTVVARTTVIERGPSTLDTRASTHTEERAAARAELQVTPPAPTPLPRWSLGLGVDDPFGARELRGVGGLRLLGEQRQLWLDLSLVPSRGLAGAGVALRIAF